MNMSERRYGSGPDEGEGAAKTCALGLKMGA